MERRGEGAVRYTGNQSLSNFRFHEEKTAEHTWPPLRCVAVFIAAPRPPAALCPTATQTRRKIHGYSQPWSISPNFHFCAKVANRSWCPYKMDAISVRYKSWEVHHLLCLLRVTHIRSISLTTQVGWGSSGAASQLQIISQTYWKTFFHEVEFFLFIYFFSLPRFSRKLHFPGECQEFWS